MSRAADQARRGAPPTDETERAKREHRLRADTDADYQDAESDSSAATMHRDGECSES